MIHVTPNLNAQQIRFCEEYLVSFNAYRAAKAAGYSENTAKKGELLHLPKIEAYLKLKQQERAARLEISHDKILREYAKIAFSNMGNYYDERGDLKPMCELSESDKASISFIQTANIAEPDGYIVGAVTKIKLHNKMAALDRIAKHLGFFGNQTQESRDKNQDGNVAVAVDEPLTEMEIAAMTTLDEIEEEITQEGVYAAFEENGDGLLRDRPVQKEGGKILTLSPLSDRAQEGEPVFLSEYYCEEKAIPECTGEIV